MEGSKTVEKAEEKKIRERYHSFYKAWNYRSIRKLSLMTSSTAAPKQTIHRRTPKVIAKSHISYLSMHVSSCCYYGATASIAQMTLIGTK